MTSTPPPPYTEFSATPPPLPPRSPSNNAPATPAVDSSLTAMSSRDPRSSSTQSLVPENIERDGRRRLLLIYIHGFQGDETSFRSFPAHVHNLVTITLGDSHTVHTKIYPKYQSRYALEQARDNFSRWLAPHEDQWTDVILLSHSMGGLIAADVALLFRHNIIGTIEFDVPFLGMHPGIVKAGLGSIFKPWPMPEEKPIDQGDPGGSKPSRMNTLFNSNPSDPNFNPTFHNDVRLPERKGWVNTLHWLNKHASDIRQAGKDLVSTHLEFGGAMADFRTLKARYAMIRALEEDDEEKRRSANSHVAHPPRIRFVNYWTASLGRPKKPKSPKSPKSPEPPKSPPPPTHGSAPLSPDQNDIPSRTSSSQLSLDTDQLSLRQVSPRISVDHHMDDEVIPVTPQEPPSATSPIADPSTQKSLIEGEGRPELPEIPPIPQEPPFVDLAEFSDRSQRKAAEKEHDQALKAYHQAIKARNKVINERDKIEEKWEKQMRKQQQRDESNAAKQKKEKEKAQGKEREREEKEEKAQEKAQEKEKEKQEEKSHKNNQDSTGLEEDMTGVQLGETQPSQSSNSPYGNYDFSNSIIMNQNDPNEQQTSRSRPSYNDSMHTDSTYSLGTVDSNTTTNAESNEPAKKQRIRKFCILPPKDAHGNRDHTWVKVDMGEMDEVAAHTTLFFISDRYEQLVGDVGARIEDWVREADGMRTAREMQGLY